MSVVKALRRVEVYPALLTPGRPWHPDRGADAFLRSARGVYGVLTDALAAAPPLATSTMLLRLSIDEDDPLPATGDVVVEIWQEERRPPRESWEGARVLLPSDVADLDPIERRWSVG